MEDGQGPVETPYEATWRADTRSDEELFHVALTERDDDLSAHAVFTLRYRGTRRIFDKAAALCDSRIAIERAQGVNVLAMFGDRGRIRVNPYRDETAELMVRVLGREKRVTVLRTLIWAASHIDDERLIGPVCGFSKHPSKWVRREVAMTLGWFAGGSGLALRTLVELCRDKDRDVRDWATFELAQREPGDLDMPEAHEVLWQRADEDDSEIRCQALRGLAARGEKGIVERVIQELARDEFFTDLVEAAAILADPRLLPHLLPLREWEDTDDSELESAIAACGGEALIADS